MATVFCAAIFRLDAVESCRVAFGPIAEAYLAENAEKPNRGPRRHYIPLPFRPPLYNSAFFNDDTILAIASGILGEQMVLDQFASDTPYKGSVHQGCSWRPAGVVPGTARCYPAAAFPGSELALSLMLHRNGAHFRWPKGRTCCRKPRR